MTVPKLFYLDTDGRLVGPESAPFPGEAGVLAAAQSALRKGAAPEPNSWPGLSRRGNHRPPMPTRRIG